MSLGVLVDFMGGFSLPIRFTREHDVNIHGDVEKI